MHSEGPDRIDLQSAEGWVRHAFIISRTAPAFLLIAIFFLFRWVLIGGEKAGDFLQTAVLFTVVGTALVILNAVVRRQLEGS